MSYPKAIYKTNEEVHVGDHILYRNWMEFWRGWQKGRVMYVPGISAVDSNLEYNGLKWVSVDGVGLQFAPLVHPETGILKGIRFVSRSDDGLDATPVGYTFRE